MGIARTILQRVKHDIAVSRNLGESVPRKALRAVWFFVYLVKAFRCAFNAMRREQLGSRVVYQGRECFISNWSGSGFPTLAGDGFYEQHVPRSEIVNVVNVRELYHRFEFGLSFYLNSWHGIDVNRKMYPEAFAIRSE